MTARDEVLVVCKRLAGASTDGTFSVGDVLDELSGRGSKYKGSTIRTHVTSRMCSNAPDHHGVVYDDLIRVSENRYRLAANDAD